MLVKVKQFIIIKPSLSLCVNEYGPMSMCISVDQRVHYCLVYPLNCERLNITALVSW